MGLVILHRHKCNGVLPHRGVSVTEGVGARLSDTREGSMLMSAEKGAALQVYSCVIDICSVQK